MGPHPATLVFVVGGRLRWATRLAAVAACLLLAAAPAAAQGGWQLQTLPALPTGSAYRFSAVSALDANRVWATGYISPSRDPFVARSTDGGASWSLIYRGTYPTDFEFGQLKMVSDLVGFGSGTFGLWRWTSDGGVTWHAEQNDVPPPSHNVGPDGHVYGMAVVDADHAWTVGWDGYGAGVIYHREPGRPQPDPLNPNPSTPWWLEWAASAHGMYGVAAVSNSVAWAVGYQGWIWKTVNGRDWGQQTSPTTVSLFDAAAVDGTTAWAVGESGTIVKTGDGGTTWSLQPTSTTEAFNKVAALSLTTAWAVGGGGQIVRTTDGGTTWTRQFAGTSLAFVDVAAVDTNTAWAVTSGDLIVHTTDGGTGRWAAPRITGVSPEVAGANGSPQVTVTISGANFRGGNLVVRFCAEPVDGPTWVSPTTIQVQAPYVLTGTCEVTVVNEDGQQVGRPRAVSYLPDPQPITTSPLHGSYLGGYDVMVSGLYLVHVSSAELYREYAAEPWTDTVPMAVTSIDPMHLRVSIPSSAGQVPTRAIIILHTTEHQVAGVNFTFDASPEVPAIDLVTPGIGHAGTSITISGTGFDAAGATVSIYGSEATITSRSATQIVATVPNLGTEGPVDITVANPSTQETTAYGALLYSSAAGPSIATISPALGPVGGFSAVTITGTSLGSAGRVTFGGFPAIIASNTATEIVAFPPPHAAGVVDVAVIGSDDYQVANRTGAYTYLALPPLSRSSRDFDADRKGDLAVYRPASGTWFWMESSTGNSSYRWAGWGVQAHGDTPVTGDFDGDGIIDPTVYRPASGTWFTLHSASGYTTWGWFGWGNATDTPVAGDYDGDGRMDGAVYRASEGRWYVRPSSGAATWNVVFGVSTDIPVPGDYDGDGRTDVAVYRPSSGTWFILTSSSNRTSYYFRGWGIEAHGDTPVQADYDGDGKTDVAVYRPASGTWFVLKSSTDDTDWTWEGWGNATDTPVPADFDGDGRADLAVYRPSEGRWYVKPSSGATPWNRVFGQAGDVPLLRVR